MVRRAMTLYYDDTTGELTSVAVSKDFAAEWSVFRVGVLQEAEERLRDMWMVAVRDHVAEGEDIEPPPEDDREVRADALHMLSERGEKGAL